MNDIAKVIVELFASTAFHCKGKFNISSNKLLQK